MFCKGYQIETTSHADLSLSIHDRINELHRRAERLAPAIERSALDSGCTDQTKASHANLGPRQRKAWNMVAEAHAWNAISEHPDELAKAEAAERAGLDYEVVGIWDDNSDHTYVVRVDGEGDEPASPFVADPANPTDDELAAAIERGLDDGSIIDAADFLAQVRDEDNTPAGQCATHGGRDLAACDPADCDEAALAASFTKPYSPRAAREGDSPRCAVCHRDAHRPGTGWQGHAYAAPEQAAAQPQPSMYCRASGGYHRWSGATIHKSPTGAPYTLGGIVTCDHCGDTVNYHNLPREEAQAICRAVAATFPGPLSESFALWALEAYGVTDAQAGNVIHDARTTGKATTAAGLFTITVRRVGYDEHVGTTYKVERNARTH